MTLNFGKKKICKRLLDVLVPSFPIKTSTGPAFFAYDFQKTTRIDGKYVCMHIDHLIEELSDLEYTNITFGQVAGVESIQSWQIPKKIRVSEFICSVFFLKWGLLKDLKFLFRLQKHMPRLPYHWVIFSCRTLLVANYFSLKFRDVANAARSAYVMVYYNAAMLGVVSAFRQQGKDVWDVQHGLLGPTHNAYNNQKAYLVNSNLKPNGFVVWSSDFGRYIESTLGTRYHSTNYRHLHYLREKIPECSFSEKRILYSLQWSFTVPNVIKEAVMRFKDIHWVFRLHPNESEERLDLQWINSIENAVLVGVEEPLVSTLLKSSLHITYLSSVVFEAAAVGVPSMIVGNEVDGKQINVYEMFSEPISAGMASVVNQCDFQEVFSSHVRTNFLMTTEISRDF